MNAARAAMRVNLWLWTKQIGPQNFSRISRNHVGGQELHTSAGLPQIKHDKQYLTAGRL